MAKLLVTGGSGFIGSNFIRYWQARHAQDELVNLDLLTYAASGDDAPSNGARSKLRLIKGDIADPATVRRAMKGVKAVVHFAAETHVDRSIQNSQIFLKTNVLGTHTLLEAARQNGIQKFVYISTDEVYGSIEKGSFTEYSQLRPNSPYAASKASGDLICRSYWVTHNLPVMVTRCCNNYGPYQFPEKVIPLFITNLIEGKKVPLYGDGMNVREWIHALDHARAIERVMEAGEPGEIYNIGTGQEIPNVELAGKILKALGKGGESIERVKDRPGHDFRYSLDSSKLKKLGWSPEIEFEKGLKDTIGWYRTHESWWKKIKGKGAFKTYIKKQYAGRAR
ncbi:MAG: dTDP-glucose 4,6-dehydratase [Elusimicrobia bacterium RIFCSPLOWO2_01_FULL_54_10]|nr:MAG: dTDP-glucose 4,6-dehydratase [Elusimicrobia bacterium RIFCSPLOWO2_01_FULL_54_10]